MTPFGGVLFRPYRGVRQLKGYKLHGSLAEGANWGQQNRSDRIGIKFVDGTGSITRSRACPHLKQARAQVSCNPAEKLRAVFS